MLKHSLSLLHTIPFYEYTTVYLFPKDANLDHFQLFAPVNKVVMTILCMSLLVHLCKNFLLTVVKG